MNLKIAFALAILSASVSLVGAQVPKVDEKAPEITAGKPLAGVSVKLTRYEPGGRPVQNRDGVINPNDPVWNKLVRTDEQGGFSFGPIEKGKYVLTVERPTAGAVPASGLDLALITINGATGGQAKVTWDLKANRRYEPATSTSTATRAEASPVIVESNGVDPISGICQSSVVKSRSNIANN